MNAAGGDQGLKTRALHVANLVCASHAYEHKGAEHKGESHCPRVVQDLGGGFAFVSGKGGDDGQV